VKALARTVVAVMVAGVLRALVVTESTGCSSDACGCDDTQGAVAPNTTVHQSLECLCKGTPESCPKSAAEYEAQLCSGHDAGTMGTSVLRKTGCGTVTVGLGPNLSVQEATFDQQSGALIGVFQAGDIPWGKCNVFSYAYGRTANDCAQVETCVVCGAEVNTPRCP
jgi:hypothetical protein